MLRSLGLSCCCCRPLKPVSWSHVHGPDVAVFVVTGGDIPDTPGITCLWEMCGGGVMTHAAPFFNLDIWHPDTEDLSWNASGRGAGNNEACAAFNSHTSTEKPAFQLLSHWEFSTPPMLSRLSWSWREVELRRDILKTVQKTKLL